jgi:hypothetical protein
MAEVDRRRAEERQAELRAERIGWKRRSRTNNQASRSMDERLRHLTEGTDALDKRLRHHAEESATWHKKWDDSPPSATRTRRLS